MQWHVDSAQLAVYNQYVDILNSFKQLTPLAC